MADRDLSELEAELAALEARAGGASAMVAAFTAELHGLQSTMLYTRSETEGLARSIGGGLRRAFDGVVFDGMRLSDALRGVAGGLANAAYSAAIRPVQDALGRSIAGGINSLMSGLLPFAQGAAFSQGRVLPFAQGGIVDAPTRFPMAGGRTGLMGEAGPEAILPLARGPDGRLGVRGAGGTARPVQVTINVTTPDAESFRRSQSQIAAGLSRALSAGARNG